MNYYLFLIQLIFTLVAIVSVWQAILYYRRKSLYKSLKKRALPKEWREFLLKVPHYRLLSDETREKLRPKMLYFAMSREFLCAGCEVTEQMRALVSFYAALMGMELEEEDPFNELYTVIIYPHEAVVESLHEDGGIFSEEEIVLEGESTGGAILVVWSEAQREALHPECSNVIIHELAHQLDFEEGAADGIPLLESEEIKEWTTLLGHRYKELKKRVEKRRDLQEYALIGEYAARSEAEFFAVLSERFFQCPRALKLGFPDLYSAMRKFYGIDTQSLFDRLG